MCMKRFFFNKELAHLTVEAEKSHNLLCASWKPRRASGVIQSGCEGLRTRSTEAEYPCPSSSNEAGKNKFFPLPLLLLSPLAGSVVSTHTGEGKLLYCVFQFRCRFHPEILSQTNPEIKSSQIFEYFMIQLS